jgi:hypothetical protein
MMQLYSILMRQVLYFTSKQMQIEKDKIYHKRSTKDYIISLGSMPAWCEILLNNVKKPYNDFLQFLIDTQFYKNRNKPLVIKDVIRDYGKDSNKVCKWIQLIYAHLVMLNENEPHLFKAPGLRHEIYYKNYDSYGAVTIWLERTPQVFEGFVFPFAKAEVGEVNFFVESVEHRVDKNEHVIHLQLEAGRANRYRELLMERALFYQHITFTDIIQKYPFQIDEKLKSCYRY